MRRDYLAKLVNQVSALNAGVIGIDFWLDRPHPEDPQFRKALESAIQRQQSWLLFAVHPSETREWQMVTPEVASSAWSLQGDGAIPLWHVKPLPWLDSTPPPFSHLLATAYRFQTEPFQPIPAVQPPVPSLNSQTNLLTQVRETTTQAVPTNQKPLVSEAMQLQTVTAFSYLFNQRWFQPILDFSIPPDQIYDTIPAWQLLEQPDAVMRSRNLTSLKSRLVMIVAGGYSEAGATFEGEDNFPLHAAIAYWRSQQTPPNDNPIFPGGEAHAYMTHHFLTQRLVMPIPDFWLVLAVIPLGKGLSLLLAQRHRRWMAIGVAATMGYGLVSLQLYLVPGVLMPWLLPSATIWIYLLLALMRRNHAQR